MRLGLSAYAPPAPVPRMPAGLVPLMEGLGRDVLRANPPDLYQFCADHMQKLIVLRASHEGRTRTMTLEEKISRAQTIIRQRAEKRRRRYDEPDRRSPGFSDEEESMDNDTRAMPLGLSPRVGVSESFRPDSREMDESSELLDKEGEPTETYAELEKDDTAKEEIQVLTDDDGDKKQVDGGNFQHSIANEQNQELHVGENNDINVEDTILEPEHTKEALEIPVVKTEEKPIAETSEVNEAMKQECDELLIENHISELGDNKNETENEVILAEESSQMTKLNESIELPSKNEARKEGSSQVIEEINRHDSTTSIEKQILDPIVVNDTVETETIENKINDELNYDALSRVKPQDDDAEIKFDDNIEITNTENAIQEKTNNSAQIQSEENKTIPDEKSDGKSDYTTEIKQKEKDGTQEKSTEMQTEFAKVNTEGQEEKINDNGTEYKTNDNKDNTLPEYTENKEPNKLEFEMVTIEVKAPTPLPDAEIQDEIIDTGTKENEMVLSEVRKDEKFEKPKRDIVKPQSEIPEVTNEVINNDINSIEITDQPSNDNKVVNEDETDSAIDTNAEINQSVIDKNSAQLDTERMSYMSIPQNYDFDINALAKSDSTNNIIIEETTESISETNTEVDEREEDTNNAPAMDLETAAVTIQKVFRTFLFKSRASTLDDVSNDEVSMDAGMPEDILVDEGGHEPKQEDEFANIKERRSLGITRMDTVLQTVNEEKSLSLSTDDSSTLSSAATTIQAHVRGFLVRNRLHSNKTTSLTDGLSSSLDAVNEQQKTKTVLNIHIVPEGGHFMSRDESMAMSLDLPLDTSPPSSLSNLHPLSFDVSERRKLLKREDAIQSISPPSNNSGKLSVDSGKEVFITESNASTHRTTDDDIKTDLSFQMEQENADLTSGDTSPTKSVTFETVLEMTQETCETKPSFTAQDENKPSAIEQSADEMDVVTPFVCCEEKVMVEMPRLLHSGECHDVVLPVTCVLRSETTVIREFKNVLGYFLLWNTAS